MSLIENNIALLSIHIPKTGGSSFQKSLQSLYGPDAFLRLDFKVRESQRGFKMVARNQTSQSLLDEIYEKKTLPKQIRVVHGHYHYEDIARFFKLDSGVKVVSWLRDPVQRIVSNYYYLIANFEAEIEHTALSRSLFPRLLKSLPEYARNHRDTQLYSDYLNGRELDEYDFLGIIENYDEEMKRLAQTLDMPELPHFSVNRARQAAPGITAEQEWTLAELNRKNIEIYQRAKRIMTESSQGQSVP